MFKPSNLFESVKDLLFRNNHGCINFDKEILVTEDKHMDKLSMTEVIDSRKYT